MANHFEHTFRRCIFVADPSEAALYPQYESSEDMTLRTGEQFGKALDIPINARFETTYDVIHGDSEVM